MSEECHVRIISGSNTGSVFPFLLTWLDLIQVRWLRWNVATSQPLVVCVLPRSPRNAGSVSPCCASSLLTTQVCEQRLCLCLLCVAVESVSQLVRRPDVLRKWWGQGGKISPPSPKKCEFIAASLGQRASGLSLPHDTIISWALSREKYGLKTQRKS